MSWIVKISFPAIIGSQFLFSSAPSQLLFEEFKSKFSLGAASTEKRHPKTYTLSQTMHQSPIDGLQMLLDVDKEAVDSFANHIGRLTKLLVPSFKATLGEKGRIFLVGSGSSGRIAIDLAAKARVFSPNQGFLVEGVIAGGDAAIVGPKEGFEDSESDGRAALALYDLQPCDMVVLISGSGSASFNVGCGHFAADHGCAVYYFYNSAEIPERTQTLFQRTENDVVPLLVDMGPQAITGSTRLQAAALAEMCLGTALAIALGGQEDYSNLVLSGMRNALASIQEKLSSINALVQKEVSVFSSPISNFRRLRDVTDQGYATLLGESNTIREAFVDTTEMPPTFSTNPVRKESETYKKREEFRAYLLDSVDNEEAWKQLLGRPLGKNERAEALQYIIAGGGKGAGSYANRPTGTGNLVLGVLKTSQENPFSHALMQEILHAKGRGALVGLICICEKSLPDDWKSCCGLSCILENVPSDPFGIVHTCALKIALNLISNGSMVLMNKVYGNLMIDVRASNYKLVDRCMRLIREIWPFHPIDDAMLYRYVQSVSAKQKEKQEMGIYTPSIVNIVLNMLYTNKTPEEFEEVVKIIDENQERLDFLNAGRVSK